MNILYISNHLNTGGITSYLLTLSEGMKDRGHNVFLASSSGDKLQGFLNLGVNFIPVPIRTKQDIGIKVIRSAWKLNKIIKADKIELIHSNSRTTQVVGCILSKLTGIAHVSTCHGFFKKRLFRKIFPCWGMKVIAISHEVREHLISDFRIRKDKIEVINNGIDINKFNQRVFDRQRIKKDLGLRDGPVIGIIARLSSVKGHVYLIEAMAKVVKEIPSSNLLIVGEGDMKETLVKLVKKLDIEKNALFLPNAIDTRFVLEVMDIFAMPSLKEGLGLALMEAMAYGVCVVTSGVGGIKTLVKDGVSGLLVEPANSAALSESLLMLLKDSPRRQTLSMNAKKFIVDNFSSEKMVLNTERLYFECLKEKN